MLKMGVFFRFSDPRKIHSEEESDDETMAETQSYLSGDFDSRGKSAATRSGTRGKRRSKASHSAARRRQKTAASASSTTTVTAMSTSPNASVGCGEFRLDPTDSMENDSVPLRLKKSGVKTRRKGKLKVKVLKYLKNCGWRFLNLNIKLDTL